MTLGGLAAIVELTRGRSLLEHARIRPQSHGSALLGETPLRGEQIDHRMRRARVDLGRVGALETAHVPRDLDHRHLHPEADAEEGDLALPRVAHRGDLPLRPTRPEPHRHEDAVGTPYALREAILVDL